jgi:hypothetical protein
MKIGGYLKADFVADFDGTLDSTQFLMRTIPVEGTPEYGGDAYESFPGRSPSGASSKGISFRQETSFGYAMPISRQATLSPARPGQRYRSSKSYQS